MTQHAQPELPSLSAQIAELKRERALRSNVYPKLIEAGRLSPAAAQRQNASLDAAIATLIGLVPEQGTGNRLL